MYVCFYRADVNIIVFPNIPAYNEKTPDLPDRYVHAAAREAQ